jgi:hypothetical protein
MTLPGFNAETSLYRANVDYRSQPRAACLAGAVPQTVDPRGTNCLPCNRGWQLCVNCVVEPGRCISWWQECPPVFR